MLDLFTQAAKDALSLVGEGSFLRGTVPCQVNIEHGVQLEGLDTGAVDRYATVQYDIATIESSLNPKVNDTLQHPDGNFKLSVLLEDTGPTKRFVIIKV